MERSVTSPERRAVRRTEVREQRCGEAPRDRQRTRLRCGGRIDDDRVRRHERLVANYELPNRLPGGAEPGRLVELMGRDKKAHGDLTFVLDGPRGVEPVRGVPAETVLEVLGGLR